MLKVICALGLCIAVTTSGDKLHVCHRPGCNVLPQLSEFQQPAHVGTAHTCLSTAWFHRTVCSGARAVRSGTPVTATATGQRALSPMESGLLVNANSLGAATATAAGAGMDAAAATAAGVMDDEDDAQMIADMAKLQAEGGQVRSDHE